MFSLLSVALFAVLVSSRPFPSGSPSFAFSAPSGFTFPPFPSGSDFTFPPFPTGSDFTFPPFPTGSDFSFPPFPSGSDDCSGPVPSFTAPSQSFPVPSPSVASSPSPSVALPDTSATSSSQTPPSTPSETSTPSAAPSASIAASVDTVTGGPYTGGVATYYYQNGNAGACGQVHSDYDYICAMDQTRFGTSGPSSPLCGLQVQITNTNNGKSVTVTIADDCPTCENENSIDLSVGAFEALSDLSVGEFPISWSYV